jgi:hypothetical protein
MLVSRSGAVDCGRLNCPPPWRRVVTAEIRAGIRAITMVVDEAESGRRGFGVKSLF